MILPDVNVLIYAFRTDNDHHAVCRAWLEAVVSGDARFGIAPPVLSAFVRITTDRRIFTNPSPPEEPFRFCDTLLGQPHCQIIEPGQRHWDLFRRLCLETNTHGSRVTDAWFRRACDRMGLRVGDDGPRLCTVPGPEMGDARHEAASLKAMRPRAAPPRPRPRPDRGRTCASRTRR